MKAVEVGEGQFFSFTRDDGVVIQAVRLYREQSDDDYVACVFLNPQDRVFFIEKEVEVAVHSPCK